MSLKVNLYYPEGSTQIGTGFYVQEGDHTRELSLGEIREKWPTLITPKERGVVYSDNITHNLGTMAGEASIYGAIWEPEETGWTCAKDIIAPLEEGLAKLQTQPDYYRQFDSPNRCGIYQDLISFVSEYLDACKKYPEATIETWG